LQLCSRCSNAKITSPLEITATTELADQQSPDRLIKSARSYRTHDAQTKQESAMTVYNVKFLMTGAKAKALIAKEDHKKTGVPVAIGHVAALTPLIVKLLPLCEHIWIPFVGDLLRFHKLFHSPLNVCPD
jgi:hypothetical protein